MDMTREEYLAYAKERALPYVDTDQPHMALTSLASDFGKHPELADSVEIVMLLGVPLALNGHLDSRAKLREFINDFQ